jgi:hypothetical protein
VKARSFLFALGVVMSTLRVFAADQPVVTAVILNPSSVVGGASVTGTVTLSAPVQQSRTLFVVQLSSSNTAVAVVPGSVTVAVGSAQAEFTVATRPVDVNPNVMPPAVAVTISAAHTGGAADPRIAVPVSVITKTAILHVHTPFVSEVSLAPRRAMDPLDRSRTSRTGGLPATAVVTLNGAAPSGGAGVLLSSSNPALAQLPANLDVPANETKQSFVIATSPVNEPAEVTITGQRNPFNAKTLQLTLTPADLLDLEMNPATVTGGGDNGAAVIVLNAPAGSAGARVDVSSERPEVAQLRHSSVVVPGGATQHTTSVNTAPVSSPVVVTFRASRNGIVKTAALTVVPAVIDRVHLNPTSLTGGAASSGMVVLTGPAPAGYAVNVSSSHPSVAQVSPSRVEFAQGAEQASFNISTTGVSNQTNVTITASGPQNSKSATLTVKPSPTPAPAQLPNLYISEVRFKNSVGQEIPPACNGSLAIACAKVWNLVTAQANAGASVLRLYVTRVTLTGTTTAQYDYATPALPTGASAEVCTAVGTLGSPGDGQCLKLKFEADATHVIPETNENNNTFTWALGCPVAGAYHPCD